MTDLVDAYKKTAVDLLNDPDDAEALSNQFTLLSTARRGSPAQLALARRCAEIASEEFIAVFNYGSALMRAGYDSLDQFKRALDIASDGQKAVALHHIGLAYHDAGEFELAQSWYQFALERDLANLNIRKSIAFAHMAAGRVREGLLELEVRHRVPSDKPIFKCGIPTWTGQDLDGKTLILAHEQGFGDTIQFIRFAPLLKKRCGRLIFSGPDALAPLIAEQFPCFDDVINDVGPFEADFVTTPLAAAALLGIKPETLTGLPYIRTAPMKLPPRGKLKVGIAWQGSPGYANDVLRSATLEDFCPLFDLPGAAFYSLQVYPRTKEFSNLGLDGFVADIGSTLTDWRSTAAAIAAMDVVVSVDSANAHMAGALGKPTLLLLGRAPCWRWMSGESTPWYRNHKLFRQQAPGQWAMQAVRAELRAMLQAATMVNPDD